MAGSGGRMVLCHVESTNSKVLRFKLCQSVQSAKTGMGRYSLQMH